jgi:glycosyltransferase involved in cell wall biosynthesis
VKVVFDHQIFSRQRIGGISRYFCELLARLPSSGVADVSVLAPLHLNEHLGSMGTQRAVRGWFVRSHLRGTGRIVPLCNRVAAPAMWAGQKVDIAHETYYSFQSIGRSKVRVITVYDMMHELFPDELANAVDETLRKRAAVDRADHIICISANTRDDLVNLFDVDPARTTVVHLGSELNARDAKSDAPLRFTRPALLFVGGRNHYKNFRLLVEAYASSRMLRNELDLVAFGSGPFSMDERGLINRLGVNDKVHHDRGDDARLAARYRAARLFVYPSRYEGFGIPPLEAMSQSCPVVCSRAASIPEVVGDAGVYFDPSSIDSLRDALERVAFDEPLRADLRSHGLLRAQFMSWDRCAAGTADVYRALS